jgi:hypothetical protein
MHVFRSALTLVLFPSHLLPSPVLSKNEFNVMLPLQFADLGKEETVWVIAIAASPTLLSAASARLCPWRKAYPRRMGGCQRMLPRHGVRFRRRLRRAKAGPPG